MSDPRIRIYLDDAKDPITDQRPPTELAFDTKSLADGEHGLRIEAQDVNGQVGVRHLRFQVRNGPGITVTGLGDGAVVHGTVRFMVNGKDYQVAESRDPVGYELRSGKRPQRITSGLAGCT